jgi:hypothetical protein
MTSPAQAQPPAPSAPASSLQTFASRLRSANPFAVNRIDRLSADRVDVSGIHQAPYEKMVALAKEACEQNRGVGAVLWGEAGAGKSHLLSRVARWAEQDHHASFVYLQNLLASPEQLPRYVLKYVISFLTGGMVGPLDRTTLFRLVNAAIREALQHDGISSPTWPVVEAAYNRLVNRLGAQDPTRAVLLDRDVYRVLFHFFRSVYVSRQKVDDGVAALAVRWLSGEPLDAEEAARIGLRAGRGKEDGVELTDDQQVKQVLVALTQLALSRRQPFLLCFDQVDNLGTDRVTALAQFLHDLLDSAGNLLVIFCGVKQTLLGYQQARAIPEAAWHRLAQYRIDLLRIGTDEGRHILEARLEKFLEPFVGVPEVKGQVAKDSLFPLGRSWYDERVSGMVDVQPRRVIDWARECWEQQQGRLAAEPAGEWLKTWGRTQPPRPRPSREEAIDALVAEKIDELIARHKQEPHTLPPSAENLAGLAYTLLEQCRARPQQYALAGLSRPAAPKKTKHRPYAFMARKVDGPVGKESGVCALFVGTSSATSAAASLRRVLQATASEEEPGRLLLVTEERQPLKLGATGQEYLDKLTARGKPAFARLGLTFDQYAELEALQAVVGLARSGDLDVEAGPSESRTVREEEVVASHHRHGRYLAHPLLREFLGGNLVPTPLSGPEVSPPANAEKPEPTAPVDEHDLREVIMARLGLTMGASSHEMAAYYAEYRAKKGMQPLPGDVCEAAVEGLAKKLHAEGKLQATPTPPNGLYLLWK